MYSLELREQIARYLSTEIDLEELEIWTVQNLPDLAADPQSDDSSLTAAVDLCLAEYSAGIRSEEDIRRYLHAAMEELKTIYIYYPDEHNSAWSGSTSSSVTQQASSAVGMNELTTQLWS